MTQQFDRDDPRYPYRGIEALPIDPARDFWRAMADQIGPVTATNFAAAHGKDIEVFMELRQDGEGRRVPHFGFRMTKPGLLPTAVERAWFDGAIANYRACINLLMDNLTPPTATEQN